MRGLRAHCDNPACGYKRLHADIEVHMRRARDKAVAQKKLTPVSEAIEIRRAKSRAHYHKNKEYFREKRKKWKIANRERNNEIKRLSDNRKHWPAELVPLVEAVYQVKRRLKDDTRIES